MTLDEIEKTLATQRTYVEVGRIKASDPWMLGYELSYEQAEWLVSEVKRLNEALDMLAEQREAWKSEAGRLRADMKLGQEFSRAEIKKRDAQLQTQYDIVDRQNSEIMRLQPSVSTPIQPSVSTSPSTEACRSDLSSKLRDQDSNLEPTG
jgi:hypothetical protein